MDYIEKQIENMITIPAYYMQFVDTNVDLNRVSAIPCHFHNEGPDGNSFTVTKDRSYWKCWGKCKCGGKVIDLHALNFNLDRDEAKISLAHLLGIDTEKKATSFTKDKNTMFKRDEATYNRYYNNALRLATTKDLWLELDYIMSFHKPLSELAEDLRLFCNKYKKEGSVL